MRLVPAFALLVVSTFACRAAPSLAPPDAARGVGASAAASDDPDDDSPSAPANGGHGGSQGAARDTQGGSGSSGGSRSTSNVDGGGSATRGSTDGGAPSDALRPGNESGADGGHAADAAAPDGSDSAPNGSASAPPVICDAQAVTLDEIRDGSVRSNVKVRLDAVATSQKFLLSHAHSGSCLFAAFVGTDPDSAGPRGVLVVSYGEDAPAEEACDPGHDAIPDDLTPGDAVTSVGYLSSYAPSTCDGVAPSPQLMLDAGCSMARTGRHVLPAPFALSFDQASALARGTDPALVRRFAGGLVRLDDLNALRPADGTGSVAPYGVVAFAETSLELHNDLEYGDFTLAGPADPQKSLVFPYPQHFAAVTGLVYLDFCTWSLTPRSRCADLDPPSDNCP